MKPVKTHPSKERKAVAAFLIAHFVAKGMSVAAAKRRVYTMGRKEREDLTSATHREGPMNKQVRPEHFQVMIDHFIAQGMSAHAAKYHVYGMSPAGREALVKQLGLGSASAPAAAPNHTEAASVVSSSQIVRYEQLAAKAIAAGQCKVLCGPSQNRRPRQ